MSIGAFIKVIANAGLVFSTRLVSFGERHLPSFLRSGPIFEIANIMTYISHALNNTGRSLIIFAEVRLNFFFLK